MPIDWLKATIEERQILYRQLKDVADRKNDSIEAQCFEILGRKFSGEYVKTLRSGKYSTKNALQFYNWLQAHQPRAATLVDEAIEKLNGGPAGSKWQKLLEDHAREDGCRLAARRGKGFEIVGLTRQRTAPKIRLGQDFYIELDVPQDGQLSAVQCYEGEWFPLPLAGNGVLVEVKAGKIYLPRHPETGKIDYLSEADDTGPFRFVMIWADSANAFEPLSKLEPDTKISPAMLDKVAVALAGTEPSIWQIKFQVV